MQPRCVQTPIGAELAVLQTPLPKRGDGLTYQHAFMSRRTLLRSLASTATLAVVVGRPATAREQGLTIGLQLYMLRDLLARDFDGTLAQVASLGIREVELADLHGKTPAQIAAMLKAHGLTAVGAHCVRPTQSVDEVAKVIEQCATMGVTYVVAPVPLIKNIKLPVTSEAQVETALRAMTLDDFRWTADRFNQIGAQVHKAGLRFAYHTHGLDFIRYGEVVAFDEMLRLTDPKLVSMELDIGNTVSAGADPLPYLRDHGPRFRLAHLKEWSSPFTPSPFRTPATAPFGEGAIDWKAMLAALRTAGIKYGFIEQENVVADKALAAVGQATHYIRALTR